MTSGGALPCSLRQSPRSRERQEAEGHVASRPILCAPAQPLRHNAKLPKVRAEFREFCVMAVNLPAQAQISQKRCEENVFKKTEKDRTIPPRGGFPFFRIPPCRGRGSFTDFPQHYRHPRLRGRLLRGKQRSQRALLPGNAHREKEGRREGYGSGPFRERPDLPHAV